MKSKWPFFRELLKHCEIIIEVLDARDIEGTRVHVLEKWARSERLIRVVNKVDLINTIKATENFVVFSTKTNPQKHRAALLKTILRKREIRPLRVVVVGYPNVGKSSLINTLAKRKAARVAPVSGTTKNIQWIRIHPQILLSDTPGIVSKKIPKEDLVLRGAFNVTTEGNPLLLAAKVIKKIVQEKQVASIEETFDVKIDTTDPYDIIEKIAERRNLKQKGGELNVEEAARVFLRTVVDKGLRKA